MANYTLTNLLWLSAGAILVNSDYTINIYIKNSECMSVDAGDSRCHSCSFSMEKNNG